MLKKIDSQKNENTRSHICKRFVRLQENWCCTSELAGVSNIIYLLVSYHMDHRTHINTQTILLRLTIF